MLYTFSEIEYVRIGGMTTHTLERVVWRAKLLITFSSVGEMFTLTF